MNKQSALMPAIGAALLLATGLALLVPGTPTRPTPPARSAAAAAAGPSRDAAAPPPAPSDGTSPLMSAGPSTASLASPGSPVSATVPSGAPMPSGIAAAGDGPDGDAALQAAFARERPSDLPVADAEQLTALARQVWLAEATGTGRERWPAYFPPVQGAGAPHFYTGVRIQAATAHTADSPGRARVDLLWTGTSPGGEFGDRRPATVTFTHTNTGWEPVR